MFDIIIVSYKALDRLKRCIDSVKKYTKEDYLITVVDNDGSEESRQYLLSLRDIQTIFPEKNLGSAAGTNVAFKRTKCEFIVLLDDDAKVTKGWLMKLHRQMQGRPDVGIVGCKILYPDRRIMSAEYVPRLLKAVGYGETDKGQRNYTRECDVVVRTCLLMKRELLRTVGYFDEGFFPGQYETMDYCLRARLAGYKIIYAGNVAVIHHHLFRGGDFFQEMEEKFLEKWKNQLPEFPLKDSHPADKYMTDGITYLEKKEFEKAATDLKKAESLDRRFSQPFYAGIAFYNTGKYKAAIKEFNKALNFTPRDIILHHYLALLYEKIGRLRDMRKEADHVLAYLDTHKGASFKKRINSARESKSHIMIDTCHNVITYYQ